MKKKGPFFLVVKEFSLDMKVGFIGIGNMGGAILNGFAAKSDRAAVKIFAFDADASKLAAAEKDKGVTVCGNIGELVERSEIIMLGVKPDAYESVLPLIAGTYNDTKILISMVTGVSISLIESGLGKTAKIIRIIPNTPALVGAGMTAVCRNENVKDSDMLWPIVIFESIGKTCEIPEGLMHCVIGVSGSSPAYTYMYIDALAEAAVKNGMEKDMALTFAAQSVLGAAKMVMETGADPVQLRINVCSPGGTTIEAVQKLQEKKFTEVIAEGFQAAVDKSKAMTRS